MTLTAYFFLLFVGLAVVFGDRRLQILPLHRERALLSRHTGPLRVAATEAQLNQFLVKLSLEEKQRLANYFLQTAEG